MEQPLQPIEQTLFADIQALIESSHQRTFVAVNAEMTMLYWRIGLKLKDHILANERADYGKKIIVLLAQKLTNLFGRGWGEKQLRHYLKSAESFSEDQIVYALRRQSQRIHFQTIIK